MYQENATGCADIQIGQTVPVHPLIDINCTKSLMIIGVHLQPAPPQASSQLVAYGGQPISVVPAPVSHTSCVTL